MRGMKLAKFVEGELSAALGLVGVDPDATTVYFDATDEGLRVLAAAELGLLVYARQEVQGTMNAHESVLQEVVPWNDVEVRLATATRWDPHEKAFGARIEFELPRHLPKALHSYTAREEFDGLREFAAECLRRSLAARARWGPGMPTTARMQTRSSTSSRRA